MSLKQWHDNGWLRKHQTSSQEIGNLIKIVDRDIQVCNSELNPDWKLGIAYNAALKLCTILLYSSGYKAETALQHYRTIQAVPLILGTNKTSDIAFLDSCRKKKHLAEYEYVNVVSESEAEEILDFVIEFKTEVIEWLKTNHPHLLSNE